jgi:DNA-binding NarL/FixJ family response regulator
MDDARQLREDACAAYERRRWQQAFELFTRADATEPLDADDLWRLASSADLAGHLELTLQLLERLHQLHIDCGRSLRAARAAFWLGVRMMLMGEHARAGGWFGRAQRIVERETDACAEQGFLLVPVAIRHFMTGDAAAARETAARVADIGEHFDEPDLIALGRCLEGKALLGEGNIARGLAVLDEVMVTLSAPKLTPQVAGIVYCDVIVCCHQFFVLDRAREWTAALAKWCDAQPELAIFNGACLVHRAELMQLGGEWPQAIEAARRAVDRLSPVADPLAMSASHYQQAEIYRLRGELDAAEAAYRRASERGGDPQPGLALLRVAQGRIDEAVGTVKRVLETTTTPWRRARFLPACVEIMLAADDLPGATAAAEELRSIAGRYDIEVLDAMASHAEGAVLMANGEPQRAAEPLRHSLEIWQRLGAPYIAARIRVLLAHACRELGDCDTAALELTAARDVFERLGAALDLGAQTAPHDSDRTYGLTDRELEVLRLVAQGKSNKEIARTLFVSERTIDRHVSNVFTKIDVHSRAAATAFAYEHGLVGGTG